MKTFKNTAKISVTNARETENGVVSFAEPLAITDDSRQWNNTRYDINSLDITPYDGTVTADHGQKISDVIGKIINLRKDGNKVLIDGIKFAVNENPLAVLAKNLMKGGFVTGVSIETIGEDPDDTLTWKNHALCGLSVVAHPNNKNAYAVVSNSIAEAKQNGFNEDQMAELNEISAEAKRVLNLHDTTDKVMNKIDNLAKNDTKNLYFSDKKSDNSIMSELHNRTDKILNKFETNATKSSGNNGGNPWHDDLGRFTTSPYAAIHATKVYEASSCPKGSSQYLAAASSLGHYDLESASTHVGPDNDIIVEGHVDENGHPTMEDTYRSNSIVVSENFTPEMAANILTVNTRATELSSAYRSNGKKSDATDELISDSIPMANRGKLQDAQISALRNILNAKTRAGSKMAKKQDDVRDILAINNTMKYLSQDIKAKGAMINYDAVHNGTASLEGLTAYGGSFSEPKKLGSVRYLQKGELFTTTGSRQGETKYRLAGREKMDNSVNNIEIGTTYKGSENSEPDFRMETGFNSQAGRVKIGAIAGVSKDQYTQAQRTVFEDYQKELRKWMYS